MSETAHPVRLWLVRHAQPLVEPGVCYGATDLPACPQDTARAATQLAQVLPQAAAVSMSGLQRAQQLAQAVREQRPDLPAPVVDTRLNEMNFGAWEMTPWDAIAPAHFDLWTADFASHRFGGQESVQEMLDRVTLALRALPGSGVQDHIWFTHAGVILAVQHGLRTPRLPLTMADWPRQPPAFGGWLTLQVPAIQP